MSTVLLANPRAAGGATGDRLPRLRSLAREILGPDTEVIATTHAGHATELAANLEAELLVVAGGDGTMNEVANGLALRAVEDRPTIGLLPAGTGSDLARTLRMPADPAAALRSLAGGSARPVDWIRVGMPEGDRVAINVLGFGLSGEVVHRVNRSSKRLGGTLTFALATARATLAWKAPTATIHWSGPDGEGTWTGPLASAFLANGAYCGGGMQVGPGADMGDGLLDLTILPSLPLLISVREARHLYDGRVGDVPGVVRAKVQRLQAFMPGEGRMLVDTDGEQPGTLPLQVAVEPGAVRVLAPWGD